MAGIVEFGCVGVVLGWCWGDIEALLGDIVNFLAVIFLLAAAFRAALCAMAPSFLAV